MRRGILALALALALAPALAITGCTPAPRVPVVAPPPAPIAPAPVPTAAEALAGPAFGRTRAVLAAAGVTIASVTMGRTFLAPTDAAWARLPPGTAEALLRPENRPSLARLLRFWTLPGRTTLADLRARAATSGARLPTAEGEPLSLALAGDVPVLTDAAGRRGHAVEEYPSADGTVFAIDGIVAPAAIEPGSGA